MSNRILDYIGLNIEKIPEQLVKEKTMYKAPNVHDNAEIYRIYKKISVKDIDILISDTDRTTDIKERYETSKPLDIYIKENTESFEELTEKASIDEIKKLESLQEKLQEKMPYFIKYDKNYLWQIFYSKDSNRYFMLFPAREGETSVLFYMIKKKLEEEDSKIFVPICKGYYEERLLSKDEITELENYIWIFSKSWPTTFEVNADGNTTMYIIGNTKLEDGIESKYRIEIKNREEGLNIHLLIKALFILVTETNYKYNIQPMIGNNGELGFVYNNEIITISNLTHFIYEQYGISKTKKAEISKEIVENQKKISEIKEEIRRKNELYVRQEKQIVLFIECKKSFFKKITYFFKSDKKLTGISGKHLKSEETDSENKETDKIVDSEERKISGSYNLSDLVKSCLQNAEADKKLKDIKADLKVLELKDKNLDSKIENAKKYLSEIEKHKKSIFDFWRFSNKDEMTALNVGEELENKGKEKKLQPIFNIDEDMQEFAENVDEIQKRKLSTEECNSVFICQYILKSINALNELEELSKVKGIPTNIIEERRQKLNKIIENELGNLKENYNGDIKTQIFGELVDDYTKIKTLKDKEHRENKKDIYSILKINKETTLTEFTDTIKYYSKLLDEAYTKMTSASDMPIFYYDEVINPKELEDINKSNNRIRDDLKKYVIGEINPYKLASNKDISKIYRIQTKPDMHIVYFSNIIYYDNANKTLPNGMDESTQVLIKPEKINLTDYKEKTINILIENNQFDVEIRKIKLIEEKI